VTTAAPTTFRIRWPPAVLTAAAAVVPTADLTNLRSPKLLPAADQQAAAAAAAAANGQAPHPLGIWQGTYHLQDKTSRAEQQQQQEQTHQ